MTIEYVISLDNPQATLETVGGKGASLARLANAGLPVPGGFHVTTAAYRLFVAENDLQPRIAAALERVDVSEPSTIEQASQVIRELFERAQIPGEVASAIVQTYASLPGNNPAVAVRSSATAEDLPEASFAGQQETYLNVSGTDAVLVATRSCWASLWTARAIGYRARQGISPDGVALAVVVQLLVPAEAAGILFTADPVSGRRDQAVISASWGLGEAVVGGSVTPDSLTVDKATGRVLVRQTADKQVMTVRVNGGTQEQPMPANLRRVPVLSDQAAAELTHLAVQIEELYGMPMDIEWAWADGRFAIVQARPITALPESVAPAPSEWPLPNPKGQYMRASITELAPDPLTPLYATLGVSAVDRGIQMMARDLLHMPEDTFKGFMLTINGYFYEKVKFTGRQWWLMLTRMVPRVPYMMRKGVAYWREVAHPRYVEAAARWRGTSLSDLSAAGLLRGILEMMDAFALHLGALMGSTMGPSAGSEGLFTRVYEKMVMRPGEPAAPAFLMGFDSLPIKGEKALFDLALWCREHPALAGHLTKTPTAELAARWAEKGAPVDVPIEDWREWQGRFREYLDRYGYSIYDMDFSKPLPMDEPAPILETLKLFITSQGKNPYERQQAYGKRREQATQAVRARLKGLKRWAFEKTLKWAQSLAPLREDGIAEIGLGYPALRRISRELGRRFTEGGAIQQGEDIFWLEEAEVIALVEALERGEALADQTEAVREREALWQARKRLTPPPMLPIAEKYLGMKVDSILATKGEQLGDTLKGVGASAGQVTATARVLHGPEDFAQMRPGDILVAGITTPAWTPLFAMAAGVVTDIGGPLSHSSIVAREYGIPAVLGTGVATKRIRSGQIITVDGSTGIVTLAHEA